MTTPQDGLSRSAMRIFFIFGSSNATFIAAKQSSMLIFPEGSAELGEKYALYNEFPS